MKWLLMLVLPIAMMLSSCANEFDVMMVERHMEAEVKIAEAKARATEAQSEAIALTVTENMSDLERYFARLQIAGLVVTPSGIKSVTTGNDVLISLTQDGKTIVRDIVTGTVIYKGASVLGEMVRSAGGNTQIEVAGDGNSVNTNKEDVKMVAIGENPQSYKAGGSSSSDEVGLEGDCEEKVLNALDNYDMNNINLGGLMRRLGAETGCVVEIQDEQVMIEGEVPLTAVNQHYAGHPDLGGVVE